MKGTIYRCFYCHAMVLPDARKTREGCCGECGSRRMVIAGKLDDDEEAAAIAAGYEFDEENWATQPSPGESLAWRD
jgi:DNA-directed RNA polymerase subunit RPC12/RpoP